MKVRAIYPLVILAFVASATSADALEAAGGQTQTEMTLSAAKDASDAGRRLDAAYSTLESTPELKAAQRTWMAFREAECKFESSVDVGGSLEPMEYSLCVVRLTDQRTSDLVGLSRQTGFKRQK